MWENLVPNNRNYRTSSLCFGISFVRKLVIDILKMSSKILFVSNHRFLKRKMNCYLLFIYLYIGIFCAVSGKLPSTVIFDWTSVKMTYYIRNSHSLIFIQSILDWYRFREFLLISAIWYFKNSKKVCIYITLLLLSLKQLWEAFIISYQFWLKIIELLTKSDVLFEIVFVSYTILSFGLSYLLRFKCASYASSNASHDYILLYGLFSHIEQNS